MNQIVLKTDYEGDVRRITISTAITFDELCIKIKKIYNLAANFTLKYIDDENDLITVASIEELDEAFRLATTRKVLRLTVNLLPNEINTLVLDLPDEPPLPKMVQQSMPTPILQSKIELGLSSSPISPPSLSTSPAYSPFLETSASRLMQRQKYLVDSTSARVNELAEEINKRTAKISMDTAEKTAPIFEVHDKFISNIDNLSSSTAIKCKSLSDQISAKQAELSELASSPELNSKLLDEIKSTCNTLSHKTNERCQDISNSLFQRLMAL